MKRTTKPPLVKHAPPRRQIRAEPVPAPEPPEPVVRLVRIDKFLVDSVSFDIGGRKMILSDREGSVFTLQFSERGMTTLRMCVRGL